MSFVVIFHEAYTRGTYMVSHIWEIKKLEENVNLFGYP